MDVKTLCLGVLTNGDKTGYEIKKVVEESFRHFFVAGFGSIYPGLADLARRGFVTCTNVEQAKRPDKKVYSITAEGRAFLVDDLMTTSPRHKVRSEFLVLMYFAHLLPADRLLGVIDDMIADFERILWDDLEHCERSGTVADGEPLTPGMRFALGYGRTVFNAALAYLQRQKVQLVREIGADMDGTGDAPHLPASSMAAGE